ncbi:MAG: hypothetical protein E7323_00745 [Clostridiales bacterium]|nr:hypothetical protein [Clostridiales bacterium]
MRLDDRFLRRLAAVLCALALLASALPLYAISVYNHPYYDDYSFSADVHQVWQETGSLSAVLRQAIQSAKETRQNWQGNYTGTLLTNVQPGIFSESLYFVASLILLTAFLLCGWFFLGTVFGQKGLGLDRWQVFILCCLTLSLLLQLMPDSGEAWYWFNGGVGNVFIYSLMMLFAALAVRMWKAESKAKTALLTVALVLLAVVLGGGSYGGGLFSLCLLATALLWSLVKKQKRGFLLAIAALVLALCFLYSMSAPGNNKRALMINNTSSPVKAVIQSFYYGVALMGSYTTLALVGVTGLLVPFFWKAAKQSTWKFSHPWLVLALIICLYCTQLTPPLFSGVHIGGGRIVNTYFISYVIFFLLYAFYLTGFVQKHLPQEVRVPANLQKLFAFVMACVLAVGLCGYKPQGEVLYGPQNLEGMKAALSIVTGEAAQYDVEMTAREVVLNDATQKEITLAPLTAVPDVFMDDLVVPDAIYDVRPSLCWYYQKDVIHIVGEEAQP